MQLHLQDCSYANLSICITTVLQMEQDLIINQNRENATSQRTIRTGMIWFKILILGFYEFYYFEAFLKEKIRTTKNQQ